MVRRTTYVDPIFYLPVEVEDFKLLNLENSEEGEVDGSESGFNETAIEDGDGQLGLPAVDSIVVLSQMIRTLKDGSHVVDVVVEVEDIEGIEKYNIRLTKT